MAASYGRGLHRDPTIRALRGAVRRRDWPAVASIFEATTDPDLTCLYARVVSSMPVQAWLGEVSLTEHGTTLPKLLLGYRLVVWGWRARGEGAARTVGSRQWRLFGDRLLEAENALSDVVAREPDNVAAWAELVVTSRARQLGITESRRRFEQVVSRVPGHRYAHMQMLQQLCAKWGGSHEEMHAFARTSAAGAPSGSALGGLVAEAHVEEWLRRPRSEWSLVPTRYFRQPQVRAELSEVAERTLLHPDYRYHPADLSLLNATAFALAFARQRRQARGVFRLIGGRVTRYPWVYLNSAGVARPVFWLQRARVYALP